jgi:molybdate transport system substrate-binding protein
MKSGLKSIWCFLAAAFIAGVIFGGGCGKEKNTLIVYSGAAVKRPMQHVESAFEQDYDVDVQIAYAGVRTIRDSIEETEKGDVFIYPTAAPGRKLSNFEIAPQCFALDELIVAVHKDNPKNIQSFNDLTEPGVRIVIGDPGKTMAGKLTEKIIKKSRLKEQLLKNVIIKAPSCTQQLKILRKKETDATIVLNNMLSWHENRDFKGIEIPPDLRETIEIHISLLTTSQDKETARLFAEYVLSEGKAMFKKWGFGKK